MENLTFNPYNQIGKLHNAGLDYAVKKFNDKTTSQDIIDVMVDYLKSLSSDNSFDKTWSYKPVATDTLNKLIKLGVSKEPFFENELQNYFLNQIYNFTNNRKANNKLPDYFKKIEQAIMCSDLTYLEKEPLLIGCAVGKYSSRYWDKQLTTFDTSSWKDFIGDRKEGEDMLPGWVKGDVAGAIIGAGVGAVVGVGVGAGPGAIIGGCSASAHELIVGILDWW